jgi:hypothetical protein
MPDVSPRVALERMMMRVTLPGSARAVSFRPDSRGSGGRAGPVFGPYDPHLYWVMHSPGMKLSADAHHRDLRTVTSGGYSTPLQRFQFIQRARPVLLHQA